MGATAELHYDPIDSHLSDASTMPSSGVPDLTDTPRMIRKMLPSVRTAGPRQAFGLVLDLLEEVRGRGITENFCRQAVRPNRIYSMFEATLQNMTSEDRDLATDHIVLAILFALSADPLRVQQHLAEISTCC